MYQIALLVLQTLNQLLAAGVAVTAFALLLYGLAFNLRDRVARSFVSILFCVVVVYVCDAIGSTAVSAQAEELWLRLQWIGIIFLPPSYLHFSDALLATTGRPSRGRRRLAVRSTYFISAVFVLMLVPGWLVGRLVANGQPAPHLERTWLTWVFTAYYAACMVLSWVNFFRAYERTITSASRRRMTYLLAGALAPALGSYPYLLFGSGIAARFPLPFWLAALLADSFVFILLIVMAYAVAFFGVAWPDRVVKRRLFKWLMRGPVTASIVLALMTLARRSGEYFGLPYTAAVPIVAVASLLLCEYLITLLAPLWERWLFHGGDHVKMQLLQTLEERLLTTSDLRQFLEAVLAAVCDRLQAAGAFVVALGATDSELMISVGEERTLAENLSTSLREAVIKNGLGKGLFVWGHYWVIPLYAEREGHNDLLGLLGVVRQENRHLDPDQVEAIHLLARRAALALEDRAAQRQVFSSIQALAPQMELLQQLRAAARYDGAAVLANPDSPLQGAELSQWVKDALTHYWGGPKLTESPLLKLKVVQQALIEHDHNPSNALRAILRQAIEQTRPEGERRFTGEWILYNILEMKFMEGRKVREIAARLAMSEADLYRKQRVAIENVANAIVEMEQKARDNTS